MILDSIRPASNVVSNERNFFKELLTPSLVLAATLDCRVWHALYSNLTGAFHASGRTTLTDWQQHSVLTPNLQLHWLRFAFYIWLVHHCQQFESFATTIIYRGSLCIIIQLLSLDTWVLMNNYRLQGGKFLNNNGHDMLIRLNSLPPFWKLMWSKASEVRLGIDRESWLWSVFACF